MNRRRMLALGGTGLVLAGLMMAAASVLLIGDTQPLTQARSFAAASLEGPRRLAMLLAVLGMATLAAATPILVSLTRDKAAQMLVAFGWAAFGVGTVLFATIVGVIAIALPALGELARTGAVSPQAVVDQVVRQPLMAPAFLGGNLTYLAWIPIGLGLRRARALPGWLGPVLATAAVVGWLGFLHVPVLDGPGAPVWPLSLALTGVFVLRARPDDSRSLTADPPGSSRSSA